MGTIEKIKKDKFTYGNFRIERWICRVTGHTGKISTAIIFLQSISGKILNSKAVTQFEDLSVHYHPLKMLFFCRPFGEHILC